MVAGKAKNLELARLVWERRNERGWSQNQLAEIASVNIRTIQRLEKYGSASHETLMAVAQAFDMDVRELNAVTKCKDKISGQNQVHLIPRITSGRDLTSIVKGADEFQFEHDDDDDPRSVQAMKGILEVFKQDVVRLYDADAVERVRVESELSQEISGLERYGYYFFGIKRVLPKVIGGKSNLICMATLYMSHSRSRRVVKDNALMVVPALLPEVAR